ncbi:MAG: NAD-dependent epimerase/dehydratase family protein [Chloroflexota bacterium]|nr:NAD-dependent epimerase/dehydratase family protein [Chloroflexota bacterium]
MRVLVTGGGGFIGSHCVDTLIARGHEVTVIDNFEPTVHASAPDYLNPSATYVEADVADEDALMRALRGVDAVSHQAAVVGLGRGLVDAPRYARTNGVGTAVLLRCLAATGVRRLVLASSMVVYGEGAYRCAVHGPHRPGGRSEADLTAGRFDPRCSLCSLPLTPEPISEDAPLDPHSVYAATKLHQEHLAFAAMRESGPAVTALRYHNTYGPRMPRDTPYAGVASLIRSQIAAGGPPRVFEDGRQLRDFVHVRDVARANVLALERDGPAVGAYNIGSGESHTILELASALTGALGGSAPIVTGEHRPSDVRHIFASSDKAKRDLGYRAEVSFERGIRDFASAPLREPVAPG